MDRPLAHVFPAHTEGIVLEALNKGPSAAPIPENAAPCMAVLPLKPDTSELLYFRVTIGQVYCPAGHLMRHDETLPRQGRPQLRYSLRGRVCHACPLRLACRGVVPPDGKGRRVRVDAALITESHAYPKEIPVQVHCKGPSNTDAPKKRIRPKEGREVLSALASAQGPVRKELLETHVESRACRIRLQDALWNQKVSLNLSNRPNRSNRSVPVVQRRGKRAHRRRTWVERWERNACPPAVCYNFQLFGIARSLATYCSIPYNGS